MAGLSGLLAAAAARLRAPPAAGLLAALVFLAACGPGVAASPVEDVPSALDDPADPALPEPLIATDDLLELLPPDAIPAIDEPVFVTPEEAAAFVEDGEAVIALEVDGDARAYPLQVLVWHEVVNDVVAGRPVAVTFCPLCNSALAFDRRAADRVLDFGVSGRLYRSALVLYDRQTESLWPQFSGEAAAGTLTGERLELLPVAITSFGDWRAVHPDGRVLDRDTGVERTYGVNPYPGLDDPDGDPLRFEEDVDPRLAAMERVVGILVGGEPVAVHRETLADDGPVTHGEGSDRLVVLHRPGTASAVQRAAVSAGRDVGTVGVFVPEVDGRALTFQLRDGDIVDPETGSTWDALGRAVDGPLAGERLEPVSHLDTFWFAWSAHHPDTLLVP